MASLMARGVIGLWAVGVVCHCGQGTAPCGSDLGPDLGHELKLWYTSFATREVQL